jgi:hypothetical protein
MATKPPFGQDSIARLTVFEPSPTNEVAPTGSPGMIPVDLWIRHVFN